HAIGQDENAFEEFQRAAELNPRNAEAQANLGLVYARRQDFEHAIHHFEAALALNPDHPLLRRNLAQALIDRAGQYQANQDQQQALVLYNRAVQLLPELAGASLGTLPSSNPA